MPDTFKTNNLVTAINEVKTWLQQDQLELLIDHNELPLLKQQCLLPVCRILQEIVYNTVKHSAAGMLRIDICYRNNELIIKTAEQGWQQKTPLKKHTTPGIGRILMESRIRSLKGQLHHDFNKKTGTSYVLIIPVPDNQIDSP